MATLRHSNEFVRIVSHHDDYNMNEDAELVSLFMDDGFKLHDHVRFNEASDPIRYQREDDDRPAHPMPNSLPQISMNERLQLRRKHDSMDIDQLSEGRIPMHETPDRGLRGPPMVISPKDIEYMTLMMDCMDENGENHEEEAFSMRGDSMRKKRRPSCPDHGTM